MEDVALHEALAGLEALIAPQLRARRLAYTYHPCDPALTVRADRDKLRQLVLNLLGNAVKYTPDGGAISLGLRGRRRARGGARADTGVGIPAERQPRIFEPFVQGERALNRPTEGVGLGLAISRELASGMGGTLTVEQRGRARLRVHRDAGEGRGDGARDTIGPHALQRDHRMSRRLRERAATLALLAAASAGARDAAAQPATPAPAPPRRACTSVATGGTIASTNYYAPASGRGRSPSTRCCGRCRGSTRWPG
jgi:hypothetical protein